MKKDKDKDTLAYQDSVTAPLDRSFDDDTGGDEDDESDKENENTGSSMTSAIRKVSTPVVLALNSDYSCKQSASCNNPCRTIQPPTTPSMVY
jgi:hypothetical protein